jgi:hypothetical protein
MVLFQFVGVNAQLYFNTKFLGVSFANWFVLQIKLITAIYVVAFTSHMLSEQISTGYLLTWNTFGIAQHIFDLAFHLVIAGVVFTVLIAGLLWMVPGVAGMDRSELVAALGKIGKSSK